MRNRIVTGIVLLTIIICMVIPVTYFTGITGSEHTAYFMDEGWYLKVRDEELHDVTMSEFHMKLCNKGDELTLINTMPTDLEVLNPLLEIYSVHSTVEVYLDEELIYSYGHEFYEENLMLGYGKHHVHLPADYAGKELKVHLVVSENNAFEGLQPLRIQDADTILRDIASGGRISVAITMFLIVFGLCCMIISFFMYHTSSSFIRTFCIALFSFLVGVWTLCNNDIIILFTPDMRIKVYLEYITFYCLPLPFTYYFRDRLEDEDCPKIVRYSFIGLITWEVILLITTFVLHFTNIVHFPGMLIWVHGTMLAILSFIAMLVVFDIKEKRPIGKGVSVGFLMASVVVLIEVLRYNFSKYFVGFANNEYSSTVPIAVLIIVVALFIDFADRLRKMIYTTTKQQLLKDMAYKDELTGLHNRRSCNEILADYMENGIPYVVFSIDMNFLKKINDTLGHDKGDMALCMFANCMKAVAPKEWTCGRMGGDEFLIIAKEAKEEQITDFLEQLHAKMEEQSKLLPDITLSAAVGYASSTESTNSYDVYAAYRLADERMYQNKREMKRTNNACQS